LNKAWRAENTESEAQVPEKTYPQTPGSERKLQARLGLWILAPVGLLTSLRVSEGSPLHPLLTPVMFSLKIKLPVILPAKWAYSEIVEKRNLGGASYSKTRQVQTTKKRDI